MGNWGLKFKVISNLYPNSNPWYLITLINLTFNGMFFTLIFDGGGGVVVDSNQPLYTCEKKSNFIGFFLIATDLVFL